MWRLLRYRVAMVLVIYFLLSLSLRADLSHYYKEMLLAILALSFSYISATSVNDLADQKIDAINHPASSGRPLITGGAQPADIWLVFFIATTTSLTIAGLIGITPLTLIAASLFINVIYSLSPVRLSYRTFLAPLVLGLAYVGIPFTMGLVIVNGFHPIRSDALWLIGLYLMFVGRIILKDFRDRAGDKKYHKPTFLLRFGKTPTCIVSFIGVLAGGLIILWQVHDKPWLAGLATVYLVAITTALYLLYKTADKTQEQIHIGIGAKMGNGLLLTLLGVFVLSQSRAVESIQLVYALTITIVLIANFASYLREPEKIVLGYKG